MKRLIIDTDTGSDDAVALLMALLHPGVKVEAITTVCGNVPLDVATKNALTTVLVAGRDRPPVYAGAERPLFRELVTSTLALGSDGMGGMDLPEPSIAPTPGFAALEIIALAKKYPGEIEIVMLGPATNVATALLLDPVAMAGVKHIYSMGTPGFGPGTTTPVAEFNVYVDAEAYDILLRSGLPITIIGFDQCIGAAAFEADEVGAIARSGAIGAFAIRCNAAVVGYNLKAYGRRILDLPDPIAMAAAIWPELVIDAPRCYCFTCLREPVTYGQVVIDDRRVRDVPDYAGSAEPCNAWVVRSMDYAGFKRRLVDVLAGGEVKL